MTGVLGRKLGRTLLYGSLLAAGCTQQAWYEGFQARARQQCAACARRAPSSSAWTRSTV